MKRARFYQNQMGVVPGLTESMRGGDVDLENGELAKRTRNTVPSRK